jgi:hypothetical protein
MAKFAAKDYDITINSVALSDHLVSASLPLEQASEEITAHGDGSRTYTLGLKDASLDLEFRQNFDASKVDATLWAIYDGDAAVAFTILPNGASVGATNPSYSGSVILTQYDPFGASVGDTANTSPSLQVTGPVTRATS